MLTLGVLLLGSIVTAEDAHVLMRVDATKLTISQSEWAEKGSVRIPRLFSSLRDAHWTNNQSAKVEVHPEVDYWLVRWKKRPDSAASIELFFDCEVMWGETVSAVSQAGDGTLTLRADQAHTHGELLRYEPQSHKNTVGYWVNADDYAHWNVTIDQPFVFNVGVLQGCGKDQGGSIAAVQVERDGEIVSSLEFKVEETGHFQNFVWRSIGELEITEPGEYQISLRARMIAHKACMDARQLHLSPKR